MSRDVGPDGERRGTEPHGRLRLKGLGIGAAVGIAIAGMMTWLDWRRNPGGIFHDAGGTDWGVVRAAFVSWFVPLFLLAGALAVAGLYWRARRR